jgi:hypothetical protein
MTLIVTMYVREGIVMASDSRLTLNVTQQPQLNLVSPAAPPAEDSGSSPAQSLLPTQVSVQVVQFAATQSDATYKTFLAPGNVGISTAGAADIQGVPIAGFIESFITEQLAQQQPSLEVDQVPGELLKYFQSMTPTPDTHFLVAGYKTVNNVREQHVWFVKVSSGTVVRNNPPGPKGAVQGVSWEGESDILKRLIQSVGELDKQGNLMGQLPSFRIPFEFFTLQDAIDFATFAIKATIDTMRFQARPKTVGGPVDVLVIKPDGAAWVQRKELRVTL